MSGMVVQEALAAMRAAHDALAACDIDSLTPTELLAAGDALQTLTCQLPTQSHRLLARLQAEATPKEMGAKSWKDVLRIRWRISSTEAHRRLTEAALLGPRRSLLGEPLEPVLAATAAAQSRGQITPEHVEVIRKSITKLPGFVDTQHPRPVRGRPGPHRGRRRTQGTRRGGRADPVPARPGRPRTRRHRTRRKRGITIGPQKRRGGNSTLTGELTPEARAGLEVLFAKYAAPGMCNPADPEPCTSGTPTQAQIDNDHRSLAQRQHDALIAVGRIALMSGQLGQLNGLPVSIIIRTTIQDLQSQAGVGVTGGGTIMPIKDVIRLAAHANHYLAVFDQATGSALDLFRAKRVASPAQRIMLIGREGGCTKPCCTVGAYGAQVHHAARDWGDGGQTNVDELGLACGPDNRMVEDGGWTTSINARGEVEWAPPPALDTGQARVNYYHRPERLLHPPDEPEPTDGPESDDDTGEPQPLDPVGDDDADQPESDEPTGDSPPPEPIGDGGCREPQPFHPVRNDDADQPDEPPDEPEPADDG